MQETQETQVLSPDQEALLEKEMVTRSSILTGKIPWAEEPGGPQSKGPQRVRHNGATEDTHREMFPEGTAEQQHQCISILQPHGHEALFSEPELRTDFPLEHCQPAASQVEAALSHTQTLSQARWC